MMRSIRKEQGNIFAALFAGVALVGILGVAAMSFMRGPLSGMTNITRANTAQTQMQMGAQLSIMSAASGASGGDCDSDTYVEPFGFKTTVGAKPTNGGLIPDEIAATKQDPWGNTYGYCAWNHGSDTSNTCGTNGANRLAGANAQAWTSLAIISAGPDKTFQTTCSAFVDTTPADGNPDTALVAKTGGSDDVIFEYSYANAVGASGGLWQLKTANPNVAQLTSATRTADVRIADQTALGASSCVGVNDLGRVRYDTATAALQVCNFVGTYDWRAAGSGGGSGTINGLTDGIAQYTTLWNVFLGDQAGAASTAGPNTGVGANSLRVNTTGARNVAIAGADRVTAFPALSSNTTGVNNVAVGVGAMRATTTGNNNTAIGDDAIRAVTTGSNLTVVGTTAMRSSTSGVSNTAVGTAALRATTTGGFNTALGTNALQTSVTHSNNTAIGFEAMLSGRLPDQTAAGYYALRNGSALGGGENTAAGYQSMMANTIGVGNTAIGSQTLQTNTEGSNNVAVGHNALFANAIAAFDAGETNVAVGVNALDSNTVGDTNVAVGFNALTANTTAGSNVAVGYAAMAANTSGDGNTVFGYQALDVNTTGGLNTAVGGNALGANTTGCCSTAIGYAALQLNTTNGSNTAIGTNALISTTGGTNVGVGSTAMISNTTGYGNVAIGPGAGPNTTNLYNTVAIGAVASVTANNSVRVGGTSITHIEGQVAWTATSDRRLKKDIEPSDLGLDFVMGLKPVSYRMKNGNGKLDYGFIAQDVAALMEDRKTNTVFQDKDKSRTFKLRHTDIIAPVVKAVQTQHETVVALEKTITDQDALLKQLGSDTLFDLRGLLTLCGGMLFGFVLVVVGRRLFGRQGGAA